MNNKACVLYFLFILCSSIIRATLYDLLHFIERESISGFVDDHEKREKNLAKSGNNFWTVSNIRNNQPIKYGETLRKHSFDKQIFQQIPLISVAENTNKHNIQFNEYQSQNRNAQLIYIDKYPSNLRKNVDYRKLFFVKSKTPAKYLVPKSTTTGLDVNIPFTNEIVDKFKDRIKAVYPGTLWCGGGALANRTSDLGFFASTDNCCKIHDMCPFYIESRRNEYGLQNGGLFTRSHCDCDREFYYCLKRTNTFVSNKIGYTYFNILGPQCFREEYPVIACAINNRNRCYSYLVDDEGVKSWQWFDNKFY